MDLIEARRHDLNWGDACKSLLSRPENHEWRIITGCDLKNRRWSYHNGGSWPGILLPLGSICMELFTQDLLLQKINEI